MDIRSSPSQQHLAPSRSSSLPSQRGDDLEPPLVRSPSDRPHKLDLYSIPVFLLEVLVLAGLAYSAFYIHFQYEHEPLISGFYCDDIAYRQQYAETTFTQQFSLRQNELTILSLLVAVPIVLIIFCELVNSMFGSLKFRQIRALCTCCKLHSITRRTIRFTGAYLLGFLIVMISCDILANTTGRLRPYFAQECPVAYQQCVASPARPPRLDQPAPHPDPTPAVTAAPAADLASIVPASAPISANSNTSGAPIQPIAAAQVAARQHLFTANRQPPLGAIIERHWVDLTGQNLTELCNYKGDQENFKFNSVAMSWPSAPAAVFTYACLFICCYLCFVGTARPFRIITSVLVMVLLLVATIFDVQLVKDHYNHWDDAAAGAVLAFIVTIFVLTVYLNRFRDTHYYENQKIFKSHQFFAPENFKGYSNDAMGHYNLDKTDGQASNGNLAQNNGETNGSISNNDLAMRYFQIPRANYRGAPRPLSSLNQMR